MCQSFPVSQPFSCLVGPLGPAVGSAAMASDEDLELQAKAMAEKTLPTSLPAAARAAKLPAIAQKILERLRKQRDDAEKPKAPGAAASNGAEDPAPPAPPPPPEGTGPPAPLRIDGVELFGDELWFDDPPTRKRLRDSVIEAHREEKILVGPPADEVERICPSNGRILGAGVAWTHLSYRVASNISRPNIQQHIRHPKIPKHGQHQ